MVDFLCSPAFAALILYPLATVALQIAWKQFKVWDRNKRLERTRCAIMQKDLERIMDFVGYTDRETEEEQP